MELWREVVYGSRVEYLFDLVYFSSLIGPCENSLLVVIRPKGCIRFGGDLESSLAVRWVVNGIMDYKLLVLQSEVASIPFQRSRFTLIYLRVLQG